MLEYRMVRAALLAAAMGCAPMTAGCLVGVEGQMGYEGYEGYEPAYYDGYVVYYDDDGVPYYYDQGAVTYVPRTYVHYAWLHHHYAVRRAEYHRWNTTHGARYRTYRSAKPGVVRSPHRAAHPRVRSRPSRRK